MVKWLHMLVSGSFDNANEVIDRELPFISECHEFCLECVIEFAIQTDGFRLVANAMHAVATQKSESAYGQYDRLMEVWCRMHTETRIIKLFCRRKSNVRSILHVSTQLLWLGSIIKSFKGVNLLLILLFFYFDRRHFQLMHHEFDLLQHMCDIICSESFASMKLDRDCPIFRRFTQLFYIYKLIYPGLVSRNKVERILKALRGGNRQTRSIARSLDGSVLHEQMKGSLGIYRMILQDRTAEFRALRSVCFNTKCKAYHKSTERRVFRVCSGCKVVTYCNRRCQKIHWKAHTHRYQCKSLA